MALFSVVWTLWLPYTSAIFAECFSVFNLSRASIDDFRSCSNLCFSAFIFSICTLRSYFLTSTFYFILLSIFANSTYFFLLSLPVSSYFFPGEAMIISSAFFSASALSLSPPRNSFIFYSVVSLSSLWLSSVDKTSPLFNISFYYFLPPMFSFLPF